MLRAAAVEGEASREAARGTGDGGRGGVVPGGEAAFLESAQQGE